MTAKIHELINYFDPKPVTVQDLIDLTEKRIKEIEQSIDALKGLTDHNAWRKRKSLSKALGLNKQVRDSLKQTN